MPKWLQYIIIVLAVGIGLAYKKYSKKSPVTPQTPTGYVIKDQRRVPPVGKFKENQPPQQAQQKPSPKPVQHPVNPPK